MIEFIGWASSMLLLLTLARQVYKQWQEGSAEGISKWFFAGQVLSSVGFTAYSYLVGNWVFTITNGLLLLNNFIGLGIYLYFRNRNRNEEKSGA